MHVLYCTINSQLRVHADEEIIGERRISIMIIIIMKKKEKEKKKKVDVGMREYRQREKHGTYCKKCFGIEREKTVQNGRRDENM